LLTSAEKRALKARGNRLAVRVILSERELTDAAVEHVRTAFGRDDLLKVRVNTKDREICASILSQLAQRVPCEIVQRVGRAALLYRAPHGEIADR